MDPQQRLLVRATLGVATGFALVTLGAFLLGLADLAAPDDGVAAANPPTRALAVVLGWLALAFGPVVGLRVGGLDWRRSTWALPVVPIIAVVAGLLG